MNRLQYLEQPPTAAASSTAEMALPAAGLPRDCDDACCLFTPQHYERNYAYPLVVWLHGPDGNERQVTQIMPLVSLRNYVAVGPRGTQSGSIAGGFGWSQDPDSIALAEERVAAGINAARHSLHVAPQRIYLAGLGCGGTMALRIALNQPRRFAGVVSIGGPLPATLRPLARLQEARRLNVLLAAGRQSRHFPEREVCGNLRLLHAAHIGLCLRLYPVADDLTTDMLADMDRWIMEQVTASQPAAHSAESPSPRRN